ncbi:hypothetical protein C3F36_22215 [Aeromonas sp. ASNIH2]|uniref:Transposase n=1 Tax=Aeromonas hydrophila TaxID=644 RepID=A0ABD7G4A2_AERHY|nr:hypothetical protein C3F36_22215 [Aeromonas sp. ASNIH2]AVO80841.1 hypothetical protein AM459_27620 [Klebsiella pneumoniae]AWD06384.1 hypothetical protein AM407_25910 [Klebsiella aerogenes]MBQ5151312.1 hypothetical protein [Citrobacter freundii]RCF46220.1 hypothetical protein C6C11_18620 [Aeromonas hydrophila]THA89035.1 hypothetical protein E6R44_22125 [Enterobacter hormaechei]
MDLSRPHSGCRGYPGLHRFLERRGRCLADWTDDFADSHAGADISIRGRLRERAKSYAKALANDILR